MPRLVAVLARLKIRSALWRGAVIGLVCAAVCWGLSATALMRALEDWAFDGCFVLRGPRTSTANVVIVALDEQSLQEIQKPLLLLSPELAKVVTYLHDQGAAAIGVDFLLPARDETLEDLLPGGRGDAELMGQAVGRAGNVVLPEWLLIGPEPLRPPFEWSVPSKQPWADLGFVDLSVDADSFLRRQQLRIADDQDVLSFNMALALVAKARHLSEECLQAPELIIDGAYVPLDAEGRLTINYVGPPGTIRSVPFREVLAAAESKQTPQMENPPFKDAIVLIGMTVGAFKDRYPTPYANQTIWRFLRSDYAGAEMTSGVEVHANVVATLLDRAFITTPWFFSTGLTLLVVGGLLGALFARCSLELGALLAVVHHVGWRALATGAFWLGNWHVETAAMLTLGAMLYAAVFAMRWRWIRRMMGMVKSEAVARALEAGGAKLDLRGRQCDITVLFCDIRDFTTFAEQHSPAEVVRLLNGFFAVAVPIIEAHGGTVNQYIGDAMMVLFGAPGNQPDHARRAVRAGLEVVRCVGEHTAYWKSLGAPQFRVGVGIHTGPAVVGTVGSPRRLDYTAIGDTVNTAARIESANKELHTQMLISRAVFAALPTDQQQEIAARGEPKNISLKGKQEVLQVYPVA